MSIEKDVETAKATIYNEDGMMTLPKEIRDKLGVSKGDKIKFVAQGNEASVFPTSSDK